jgi:hypothetical protein
MSGWHASVDAPARTTRPPSTAQLRCIGATRARTNILVDRQFLAPLPRGGDLPWCSAIRKASSRTARVADHEVLKRSAGVAPVVALGTRRPAGSDPVVQVGGARDFAAKPVGHPARYSVRAPGNSRRPTSIVSCWASEAVRKRLPRPIHSRVVRGRCYLETAAVVSAMKMRASKAWARANAS